MLPYTCSYTLPKSDCGVLSVVLSRWDDIVGPKTVRVWFQEITEDIAASPGASTVNTQAIPPTIRVEAGVTLKSEVLSRNDVPGVEKVHPPKQSSHFGGSEYIEHHSECIDSNLFSAIKYVTNHTVNCLSVASDSLSGENGFLLEKGTSFYAVPDVNLVFISLMFLVKEGDAHVPYSFALTASYDNYHYFLRLRDLCLQWLRRIAFRFHTLMKNSESFDSNLWKNLNGWILDFCNMLIEVKETGIDTSFHAAENVVKLKVIKRALTSHLQTFGSSVVIGETADVINNVIAFLGLFLDDNDKYSTCLINPPRKYSYHMGLKLQGLLLDEYGGRDLASLELMSNPFPVTVIDLTLGESLGAVKQTSNFHSFLVSQQEMYKHEYRFLNEGNGSSFDHVRVMNNVRNTGKLVNEALRDMELLPAKHWNGYIKTFLRKLNRLALSMISLISWMRSTGNQGELIKFPGESKGGMTLATYLKDTLRLDNPDFFIVLSVAEKLKPGTYIYVTGRRNS